jgi:hypothetical protein
MLRHQRVAFTPNLRTFISKVITPVVLVAGVLFLVYFNFSSVLKTSETNNDQLNGMASFSLGGLASRFQETAGIDRPALRYNGNNLLSYSEWSSTVSVDGDVQEIWNNNHGYEVDQNKRQVYSTTSGSNWQLIEIVTLVDAQTVTVTFEFTARPASVPGPRQYTFDIAHVASSSTEWYNVKQSNNRFTGQVIKGNGIPTVTAANPFYDFGTLSVSVSGPAVQNSGVQMQDNTTVTGPKGSLTLAQEFNTEYQVTNPSPFTLITLGTETLTFKPAPNPTGAPSQSLVPLPGQ